MQTRSIAQCVILTIVTCGIYGIYWFIVMTDDVNQACGEYGATSGGMSFLLTIITCNIYGLFWAYKMGESMDMAKRNRGMASSNSGVMYLLLMLFGFGIINYCLIQNDLNKVIESDQNRSYPGSTY